jgi:hypothetical protein
MVTLIDSTVRATIRHSDNPPTASEPATAWVNRDKATGAERPLEPKAPDDRVMVEFPEYAGERIARTTGNSQKPLAILGRFRIKTWQNNGIVGGYARYSGPKKPRMSR